VPKQSVGCGARRQQRAAEIANSDVNALRTVAPAVVAGAHITVVTPQLRAQRRSSPLGIVLAPAADFPLAARIGQAAVNNVER
jgi:hypothetical protein